MKTPHRDRPGYRPARFLLTVAMAALLMVPAAAAQAHDAVETTDPANGSVVGAVPAKIGLTFTHTPIAIGSVIRVEDPNGADQADGPVAIVDNHVTQAVKTGAPAGKYNVIWRVVSSDGHPTDGTLSFTAAGAGTDGPAVTGSTAQAAPAVAPGDGTDRSFSGIPAGVLTGAAVTLALVMLLGVVTRRRLGRAGAGS